MFSRPYSIGGGGDIVYGCMSGHSVRLIFYCAVLPTSLSLYLSVYIYGHAPIHNVKMRLQYVGVLPAGQNKKQHVYV